MYLEFLENEPLATTASLTFKGILCEFSDIEVSLEEFTSLMTMSKLGKLGSCSFRLKVKSFFPRLPIKTITSPEGIHLKHKVA